MELWIRSQDRRKLSTVNYFEIVGGKAIYGYQNYANFGDVAYDGTLQSDNEIVLGRYDSEERCIEILDEIQGILKPQVIIKSGEIAGHFDGKLIMKEPTISEFKEFSTYVYEMPKE